MNKDLKFEGTITKIMPKVLGTTQAGKEWEKLEFIVTDSAEYPQIAKFELFNKPDIVKFLKEGQTVSVSFNIKTNEWKEKYYTGLQAWRVDIKKATETNQTATAPQTNEFDSSEVDDLPF